MQAPEIDGEVPGHGDDGFLACGSGGPGAFGQHPEALLDRWILRLKAHEPPSALDQGGSQSRVPPFRHAAGHPFTSAAVFAGA